jgi:hypothetical protein
MIPREYFLYPSGYDQIANEQPDKYSIDIKRSVKEGWMKQEPTEDGQGSIISLIPKNGIFLAVTGADFPLKCYPDASAVFATNLVKAMIIETLKLVGKWYLLPFLLLINKQKALDAFNRVALKAVSPTLLKDECLTNFSRETKRFIEVFVSKLGLTGGDQLAVIVSNLIDYDNAYRLRLEDVLSETSKYRLLKNPRKEIRRLVGILKERETLRCEIKKTKIH